MPHRHWFVVVTVNGVERRSGPYATRKTAVRKAGEHHTNALGADVSLVYDTTPPAHTGRH